MSTEKNDTAPLHVEVAVGVMIAGLAVVAGLLITVWTEDWTPLAVGSIIGAGVLFVAMCIPQIKAASAEAKREGDEE